MHKRRAPARGVPRLVRITQNALLPRLNTTGYPKHDVNLWQLFDGSLSVFLIVRRICEESLRFSGAGGGLGMLSILIILGLMLFSGVDPRVILQGASGSEGTFPEIYLPQQRP